MFIVYKIKEPSAGLAYLIRLIQSDKASQVLQQLGEGDTGGHVQTVRQGKKPNAECEEVLTNNH